MMKLLLVPTLICVVACNSAEPLAAPGPIRPAEYQTPQYPGHGRPEPLESETRQFDNASKVSSSKMNAASQSEEVQFDLSSYKQAYAAVGKPRVSIFFNRHISDPVAVWSAMKNVKSSFNHDFENKINRSLLKGRTRIIDRDTVLQLCAVDSNKTAKDLAELLARKRIEVTALRKYTDIFVEIHVKADSSSPCGYLFRSVAKEVKTGQIIADVLCNSFTPGKAYITAGESGYEIKQTIPDYSNAANILANKLMADLTEAWQ